MASVTPSELAYWYLRFNGYLQLENFIVHPARKGSARTDADIIGVRFPFRWELGLDYPDPMTDDVKLASPHNCIDVIVVEVKTNQDCSLNGPWTDPVLRNVDRLLAAVGCVKEAEIREASAAIYATGIYRSRQLQIRLVAIGRVPNADLLQRYPSVTQLVWSDTIEFIWTRFSLYSKQKRDVNQWAGTAGSWLRDEAGRTSLAEFTSNVCHAIGARPVS